MKYLIVLIICTVEYVSYSLAQNETIDWSKVKSGESDLPKDIKNAIDKAPEPVKNSSASELSSRITNGKIAKPQQFPYQAGLLLEASNGDQSWCGGSLISKYWILTAAHCLKGIKRATVFLGAVDIYKNEPGQVRMRTTDLRYHEKYDSRVLVNDIGLIKLPEPAPLSESIEIISLSDPSLEIEGSYGIASGWGRISDTKKSTTNILRYAELKIMPLSFCQRFYGKVAKSTGICVDGSNQKSTCQGDSGGPLVVFKNGLRYLVGATSFGSSKGCEKGAPVVFTRVSSYLNWIKENTGI